MSTIIPLNISPDRSRYHALIGTGGIGYGMFFALRGNHTLGREESRLGRFLDRRDYCKLHIISHYVQALLGPSFTTVPLGKVGNDRWGEQLFAEMASVGMDMRYVARVPGVQTLFSFCYVYPDNDGGNMTTDNSACEQVDAAYIATAEAEIARYAGDGMVLAVPEVPLEARTALLRLATAHGLFRIASFNSAEMPTALQAGYFSMVDLLAINIDEARMAADVAEDLPTPEIVERTIQCLQAINPDILVSITAGKDGSWGWDGTALTRVPPCQVDVVSTAGAGDAYLGGTIAGLVAGLPMAEAQQLGGLVGGLSVTSPHTINKDIDRQSLCALAAANDVPLAESVVALLRDGNCL